MSRALGLSDEEFWKSTPAKITAIRKAKRMADRRRDYFPALLASMKLNSMGDGTKEAISAIEILSHQYAELRPPTVDPDIGAQGNITSMWLARKAMKKNV